MRLCRFVLDEMDFPMAGFYRDDHVIPITQACETFCQAEGLELLLPASEDLIDLLPPNGQGFHSARMLAEWVEKQDEETLAELAVPMDQVTLLTPFPEPKKLLLLAGNYEKHVREHGGVAAAREETFPYVFMKPPSTTITHPFDPVIIPKVSPDKIDWECELGVVIGKTCKHVDEKDALGYVAGYTVVNDVTDREYRPNPGRTKRERDRHFDWMHGKWHDTFCPIGPGVLAAGAGVDPQAFKLKLEVNGQVKQDASTAQMTFPVAAVVAFLSRMITLEPGDIIATGTPEGTGHSAGTYLLPGDVVKATIEGIGTLENPIAAEDD